MHEAQRVTSTYQGLATHFSLSDISIFVMQICYVAFYLCHRKGRKVCLWVSPSGSEGGSMYSLDK